MKQPLVLLLCLLPALAASAAEEVWITDLEAAAEPGGVSRDMEIGKWLAADYTVEGAEGVMLYGVPGNLVRPAALKLGVSGWYEVRLGLFYGGDVRSIQERYLSARLTRDPGFSRIGREAYNVGKDGSYPEKDIAWNDVAEVLWKCADLTGQDLVIDHPDAGTMSEFEANLTWIRLVPMDEAAVARWQEGFPRPETKRLVANFAGDNFEYWCPTTHQDFMSDFEGIRDSDFDIVLYAAAHGAVTFYPTQVGEFIRDNHSRARGIAVNRAVQAGINPLEEAIRCAHACGMKLFPQNRLTGPQLPPEHVRTDFGGRFLADHPEWMATYPDGEPTRHHSFAFPGVRDFHVRLMREWVEDYKADGINMLFSRSFPFVYYEEPVCEAFQAQYGEDMRQVPESDPRVWKVRAGFMTQFFREVRAMLDEVGAAQGRHIPACYIVPYENSPANIPPRQGPIEQAMFNALDLEAWAREGLVDYLDIHLHVYREHDGTALQPVIQAYADLIEGTDIKLVIDIYPRRLPPRVYRKIAMNYYAAGADMLAFWDTQARNYRASEWAFVRRLGHVDDLPRWEGVGDDYFRKVPLTSLDGFLMNRVFTSPTDG